MAPTNKAPTDKEGYLLNLADWNPDVARQIARMHKLRLDERHWEVLRLVRAFYRRHELSPAMRPLVKQVRDALGEEKGSSLYLHRLFPGSPAKLAAKIAGLPRPSNCL